MAPSPEAVQLAGKLRSLRESHGLKQRELALALGDEGRVAVATISSWESLKNPKLPPLDRLRTYALFFSQPEIGGRSRLPGESELDTAGRDRFHDLHQQLIGLRDAVRAQTGSSVGGSYTWDFEEGPITIICPEAPADGRSPLAKEGNPNHTRLYRYADLDSLVELWGHIRSANPELTVGHQLPNEVEADNLSGHLVVLGGIVWNRIASRLQRALNELPVEQVKVTDVVNGEIFRLRESGKQEFRPQWDEPQEPLDDEVWNKERIKAEQAEDAWKGGKRLELAEDVALLARLPNPFNHSRTVTICNGVYSRGVLGAVRTLTDAAVRDKNEAYIASRFPEGSFLLLTRVPIVNGKAISPDLEIAENRLYEWSPEQGSSE